MKEELYHALANLLRVKSIWSLGALGVFVYLAVCNRISGEIAMATVTAIVTYYFTKKDEETVIVEPLTTGGENEGSDL